MGGGAVGIGSGSGRSEAVLLVVVIVQEGGAVVGVHGLLCVYVCVFVGLTRELARTEKLHKE